MFSSPKASAATPLVSLASTVGPVEAELAVPAPTGSADAMATELRWLMAIAVLSPWLQMNLSKALSRVHVSWGPQHLEEQQTGSEEAAAAAELHDAQAPRRWLSTAAQTS